MADSAVLPSWNTTEDACIFDPTAPDHIPRAWERAPKSPIISRHNGRKIWKRHDGPSKGQHANLRGSVLASEESRTVLGDDTNILRPVKRMRLKDSMNTGLEGKENKMARSFATLHDKAPGTPKRKQASRRGLNSDRPAADMKQVGFERLETPEISEDNVQQDSLRASESPALNDVRELLFSPDPTSHAVDPDPHSSYNEEALGAETAQEDQIAIALEDNAAIHAGTAHNTTVTLDTDTHSGRPALDDARSSVVSMDHMEEDVKADALMSSDQPAEAVKGHKGENTEAESEAGSKEISDDTAPITVASEASSLVKHATTYHTPYDLAIVVGAEPPPVVNSEVALVSSQSPVHRCEDVVICSPSPAFSPIVPEILALTASVNALVTPARIAEPVISLSSPSATPKLSGTLKLPHLTELLRVESPGHTPQIGTSLLRRESLRRKESPDRKRSSRRTRSPKKRETLSRRDTLQEREILQKVISESKPEQCIEDLDNGVITAPAPDTEALQENAKKADSEDSQDVEAKDKSAHSTESVLPNHNEEPLKDIDLHRTLEANEAYERPKKTETSGSSATVSADDIQATKALDDGNQSIAIIEIDAAVQALETDKNPTKSSNRKTRSGARFSDDTSMLKEFLNRAQAKKAAKTPILSVPDPSEAPKPQISPRRSPRKALGSHDGNAFSPRKHRDMPNRPATPPGKLKFDAHDSDEVDEISGEVTSCRRSTRTRPPAPSKAPPGAPSFIPVRRTDGADPVVLQKSQAQELAMVTRANTRRNKGQSKPPLLALQELPAEITENTSTIKQRAEDSKTVGWAEKLASYQDAKDADEAEGTRPKVRRMRGPSAANGTPGPKRTTAVVNTSNGTPAPKRRGRV
ncbi:hypothetical protein N7G274_006323 [Stereocaulon virgatum]|uniref:Uncharacterized protein n=1 Tax=Stereocaulon virgatum TaxID=373712 RepID=A0ABR4A4W0_9LECA